MTRLGCSVPRFSPLPFFSPRPNLQWTCLHLNIFYSIFHVSFSFCLSFQCWGRNPNGQCGLGDVETYGNDPNDMGDNLPFVDLGTGRTAVKLAAGDAHVCALLDDASVKVCTFLPSASVVFPLPPRLLEKK